MATTITSDCISCGACEPECPNNAISQGDPIYVIDPKLCTECVGFHDYEACAAVCPVDCCVTDPRNIEPEEALIARARQLHQETNFGENYPSRFRKGSAPAANAEAQETEVAVSKTAAALSAEAKPGSAEKAQPDPLPPSSAAPAAPSTGAGSVEVKQNRVRRVLDLL